MIAVGEFFTVTVAVAVQPAGNVYVMVVVPGFNAVTTPEVMPTVATAVLLLPHEPPPVASPRPVVGPTQRLSVPLMGAGDGFTVTVAVVEQPPGSVYPIITAVAADTPVTRPEVSPTVASVVAPLLQVPPGVASYRTVVNPTHTLIVPVMAAGSGFTVTVAVAMQPAGKV
jgi:hypothetical protein